MSFKVNERVLRRQGGEIVSVGVVVGLTENPEFVFYGSSEPHTSTVTCRATELESITDWPVHMALAYVRLRDRLPEAREIAERIVEARELASRTIGPLREGGFTGDAERLARLILEQKS